MRISHGLRAAVAVAWLVAAAVAAGCSTTVDGAARCPGCGTGSAPEFPTASPEGPPGGGTLTPDANGYVYIETRSASIRCQISADTVGCESQFTDSPTIDGEQANGAEVSASGSNRWVVGNLGAIPTVTIDDATYQAVGWTIESGSDGTRFTNDGTGHGMFVSTGGVEFF